jgi:membrane protease YdiL (CAAX protease family)
VSIVFVLWAGYTVLQTLFVVGRVGETWSALLGLLPGVAGVAVLLAAGLDRRDCFLAVRPPSWRGVAVLAAIFLLGLAAVLPVSQWQGWSWRAALLLAPAGGIAQELFFRSSLLPALQLAGLKPMRGALLLHAVLFSLWHIGPLFLGAPLWGVAAVLTVAFISGLGWGWQVQHDRTVLWAMVQHALFWVIGLQFAVVG